MCRVGKRLADPQVGLGEPPSTSDAEHEAPHHATGQAHWHGDDCLAQLGIVDLLQGRLTSAMQRSERGVELAEHGGWVDGPAAACAYMTSGAVAYGHGEFERAEGLLTRAARAAATAEAPVRLAAGALQARALAAVGPRSAARDRPT